MSQAQKEAVREYRSRLGARGLVRFEVLGRVSDRTLIRSLARRLAEDGPEAAQLRTELGRSVARQPPATGGILAALLRAPAEFPTERERPELREIDL